MRLEECIQYISDCFFSDTIELFDNVLCDSIEDPQYSAITALNRFHVYLQFKKIIDETYKQINISMLLSRSGYSATDINLFRKKVQDERNVYHGEVLDNDF